MQLTRRASSLRTFSRAALPYLHPLSTCFSNADKHLNHTTSARERRVRSSSRAVVGAAAAAVVVDVRKLDLGARQDGGPLVADLVHGVGNEGVIHVQLVALQSRIRTQTTEA